MHARVFVHVCTNYAHAIMRVHMSVASTHTHMDTEQHKLTADAYVCVCVYLCMYACMYVCMFPTLGVGLLVLDFKVSYYSSPAETTSWSAQPHRLP